MYFPTLLAGLACSAVSISASSYPAETDEDCPIQCTPILNTISPTGALPAGVSVSMVWGTITAGEAESKGWPECTTCDPCGGFLDVVVTMTESAAEQYHVSWFSANPFTYGTYTGIDFSMFSSMKSDCGESTYYIVRIKDDLDVELFKSGEQLLCYSVACGD